MKKQNIYEEIYNLEAELNWFHNAGAWCKANGKKVREIKKRIYDLKKLNN